MRFIDPCYGLWTVDGAAKDNMRCCIGIIGVKQHEIGLRINANAHAPLAAGRQFDYPRAVWIVARAKMPHSSPADPLNGAPTPMVKERRICRIARHNQLSVASNRYKSPVNVLANAP